MCYKHLKLYKFTRRVSERAMSCIVMPLVPPFLLSSLTFLNFLPYI